MCSMGHRERVRDALNHRQPDRVPLDLGSHPNASIHIKAYENLKSYLGVQTETKVMHRWMQVAQIDEAVLTHFEIDTRRLPLGNRDNPTERELDEFTYVDQWGVVRWKQPGTDYFELKNSPLSGEISNSNIVNYPWPDPHDPGIIRGLRERAIRLRRDTDYAIVLTLPAAFVHYTQFLRGFEDWYIDCASDPKLIGALMDAVLDVNIATVHEILGAVGDLVDVIVTADDVGDQRGTIISPEMYRRLIKPRQRRYFDEIHRRTDALLLYHSCGSIFEIIQDLIGIGVDVINPVQVSAARMDTFSLKYKFGDRLSFWGAIDTHDVLPHGSPIDVRAEVRRRIADLGIGGGYVLSSVHNIQPEVKPENICAMFEAALEYGDFSGVHFLGN